MTDNQPPERYELEQLLSRDQLEIPGKNWSQKSRYSYIFRTTKCDWCRQRW